MSNVVTVFQIDMKQKEAGVRDFDAVWGDVARTLTPGLQIRNWSKHSGFTGGEFRVASVNAYRVEVQSAGVTGVRGVPKSDFQKVYACWPDYVAGKLSRKAMGDVSQNTTYIFSILKFLESRESFP